jgi:hypothetical protein
MRRNWSIIIILVLILFSTSCVSIREQQKSEYGELMTAVTLSSDKVYGEYGDNIPSDFNGDKFMIFIKGKIPDKFYGVLEKYRIEVEPKGSYYLLLVFNRQSGHVILFDYSCTLEPDGKVWLEPDKYDLNNIGLYDKCKTRK